jgi:hypothetical protein
VFVLNQNLIRHFELSRPEIDKIYVQRYELDHGKACLGVSDSSYLQQPIFKNGDEVKFGIKILTHIA